MGIQYPVHDLRDHPWYYAFLIIAKHYFYSFFCLRCGCILVPETFFDKSPDSVCTDGELACTDAQILSGQTRMSKEKTYERYRLESDPGTL